MKKIIITESQLRILFEQSKIPNQEVRFGDSISDEDAVKQLQDNNGEVYSIELGSEKTTKSTKCKDKPNIAGIITILEGEGVSSSEYITDFSTANKGCYVLYKSKTEISESRLPKRAITFWGNNNLFFEFSLSKDNWFSLAGVTGKDSDKKKEVISISYLGRYDFESGNYKNLELIGYQYYDGGLKRLDSDKNVKLPVSKKETKGLLPKNGGIIELINGVKNA